MARSRAWSFTINNYTFEDMLTMFSNDARYLIFGFECGTTEHIQGYIYFDNARSFKSMRSMLPRAHIEKSIASPQSNIDYCKKEGEFYEFGEIPEPGKRNDLESLVSMIEDGYSRKEIREAYPKYYFMYKNKIESMVPVKTKNKDRYLYIQPETQKYAYSGAYVQLEWELWEGEDIMVMPAYTHYDVQSWNAGFPPKTRRGFEIVSVDPKIIILTYKDKKEEAYLNKLYQQILVCPPDGDVLTAEDVELVLQKLEE